jgi:hypothetical protein
MVDNVIQLNLNIWILWEKSIFYNQVISGLI